MSEDELKPVEGGELYKAAREEVAGPEAKPEDLMTFDQLHNEEFDKLEAKWGEAKAAIIINEKLLDLVRDNQKKIAELLEKNII